MTGELSADPRDTLNSSELLLSPRDINRATLMVLSNYPPKPVDVLFFYGRSFGDETDLFELAASLYHEEIVSHIAIVNTEGQKFGSTAPFEAHIGKTEFRRRLRDLGVPDQKIVEPREPGYHTRQETDAFMQLAREMAWTSSVSLSQPHQVLRIVLGTIKAAELTRYAVEIYSVYPKSTSWQGKVKGSQGAELKRRIDHADDELERIPIYQSKGDIASFEELYNYLEKQENGSLELGRLR